MALIKVKFLEDGAWMDEPSRPIFDVKAGEIKEVSSGLANVAIAAGKAEFFKPVEEAKPVEEPKKEEKPRTRFSRKKAGPIAKAEG